MSASTRTEATPAGQPPPRTRDDAANNATTPLASIDDAAFAAIAEEETRRRLDEEIEWYDVRSTRSQLLYKWLKFAELITAAAIPLVAVFDAPTSIAAVLGAIILILEGVQHVNQYQSNWTGYRSTCEALKHEKYLYLARAGPYSNANAAALLAERIEGLISQENAMWVSARQDPIAAPTEKPSH